MRQWRSLEPTFARLVSKRIQNPDTITYRFEFLDPIRGQTYSYRPGQFNVVSLFGQGEAPVCITALDSRMGYIQHTMCHSLESQHGLAQLKTGDLVGLRGPFGTAWPVHQVEKHHVVFVAEGAGLAPLMSAIQYVWQNRDRYIGIDVVVGSKDPHNRIFISELLAWKRQGMPVHQTVDVTASTDGWSEAVGPVTAIIPDLDLPAETVAFMCAEEETLEQATHNLYEAGVNPRDVYVSLAARMKCGKGQCGRCTFDSTSVCKDGPIFSAADLRTREVWV